MFKLIIGRAIPAVAVMAASGVAGLFGLELTRSRAESQIFKERLEALTDEHAGLIERYNTAVRRSAVTELMVEDGELSVIVRTRTGELDRVQTPYDPTGEIYVDFALIDGRVWIRRRSARSRRRSSVGVSYCFDIQPFFAEP